MNGRRTFRREDTGEVKDFVRDSYRIDTTTQLSSREECVEVHFYRAVTGDDRIDQKPDGSFKDKWGAVWVPVDAAKVTD